MQPKIKIQIQSKEVEVYLASSHQFLLDNQQQLLPDWDIPVNFLIIVLQRSAIALNEISKEVFREKDRLRAKFIRFGCNLIFALQERGYKSDLFDPRSGYPLLARQGELTFDDNAAVKASLHYKVISYQNCSLLDHPTWGNNVYPSTIITSATLDTIELLLDRKRIDLI